MEELPKSTKSKNSDNTDSIDEKASSPSIREVKSIEEKLLEANPQIFKGVTPERRQQIVATVAQLTYHQGPLPHPELLAGYDAIIKNGGERIMVMAEDSLKANIEYRKGEQGLARFHSTQTFKVIRTGQWMGFILVIFFVGLGAYMTVFGHENFGKALIGTTLVSVAGIFIWSVFGKPNSNNKKDDALPEKRERKK